MFQSGHYVYFITEEISEFYDILKTRNTHLTTKKVVDVLKISLENKRDLKLAFNIRKVY